MSQKKILIVDDDPSFLEICSAILIEYGYAVDTATDTAQGLEKLVSRRPDLLILDVMMAAMDEGIAFATSLKKREDVRRIPIMIVSARPDTEKGYKRTIDQDMDWLAADIFMEKPVMPQDLLHNVRLLLERAY
jgi:DNA-binding response OmpR family regulator